MWVDHYEKAIREKIDWICYQRHTDFDAAIAICRELLDIAYENSDSAMEGFCYYYMSECQYAKMQVEESLKTLSCALKPLEQGGSYNLLGMAYNLMGTIYVQIQSYEAAVSSFLNGIRASMKHSESSSLGFLYFNIANVYQEVGLYQQALDSLWHSRQAFLAHSPKLAAVQKHCFLSIDCLSVEVLLRMGKVEDTTAYLQRIEETIASYGEEQVDRTNYWYIKSVYSLKTKEQKELDENISRFVEAFMNNRNKYDSAMSVEYLMQELYAVNRYDLIRLLEPAYQTLLEGGSASSIRLNILKILWRIEKDPGAEHSLALMQRIVDTHDECLRDTGRSLKLSIQDLVQRNEDLQKTEHLKQMASIDVLTGLWNRSYFEKTYEEKVRESTNWPVALGILDIDYFKQYNDNYGHLSGDQCLIKVAQLLSAFADERLQFCRYGGDEFLLLAFGYSRRELEEMIRNIFSALEKEAIPHAYSPVANRMTISLGATFLKNAQEALADGLNRADALLYQIKNNGKAHFLIGE